MKGREKRGKKEMQKNFSKKNNLSKINYQSFIYVNISAKMPIIQKKDFLNV